MLLANSRRIAAWVALALIVATVAGCDSPTEPPLRVTFDAEVLMMVLEGPNTWVLKKLDSHETYYPLNLPVQYQEEGRRVRVEGLLIRHYEVLLHKPVEIVSINSLPS